MIIGRFNTALLIFSVACFLLVLFVNGAIPFWGAPTLGQALWVAGFGQSFVNESLLSVYARDFGYPTPAPIAFGLAGAYPTGLAIAAGIIAIDAYTIVVSLWLLVAFTGAYSLSVLIGLSRFTALLTATLWLCSPFIWGHAGYSMLSIGFALLPFYLNVTLIFINSCKKELPYKLNYALFYILTCLVSVFMDGYSFVMFASCSSTFIIMYIMLENYQKIKYIISVHIVSFASSYTAYALYFPDINLKLPSMDFFRGWGSDLSFFAVPTCGVYWLADLFSSCLVRSDKLYYGDASVWTTTFILPGIIAVTILTYIARPRGWLVPASILIGLFAFYMSLGPTLKFFTVKPTATGSVGPLMPAAQGWFETGSSLLSERVPGLSSMRASYRWATLLSFAIWMLIILSLSKLPERKVATTFVIVILIVLSLPKYSHFEASQQYRKNFFELENGIIAELDHDLRPDERVAFLPYRNDFLVNYLAPRIHIRAFNIGGDKNLAAARRRWPEPLQRDEAGRTGAELAHVAVSLLAEKEADAVVFPYFDMLKVAHAGPSENIYKEALTPVVERLSTSSLIEVLTRQDYTVVRLSRGLRSAPADEIVEQFLRKQCLGLACLRTTNLNGTNSLTQVGQYKNGQLTTTGRTGFLLFGPYANMNPGNYRLIIRGTAKGAAWADVVSENGQINHGKFNVCVENCFNDVLVDQMVELQNEAKRLEIRLFVHTNDIVKIDGYELVGREEPRTH